MMEYTTLIYRNKFQSINGTGDFKLIKFMCTQHKIVSGTLCGLIA